MVPGIDLIAVAISPMPSFWSFLNSLRSVGGVSFVVSTVHRTLRRKTTAPMVKARWTVWGIGWSGEEVEVMPNWE